MTITGAKVFSATKARDREDIEYRVNDWLEANPGLEITDKYVMLSSDREFHCLSLLFFYTNKS